MSGTDLGHMTARDRDPAREEAAAAPRYPGQLHYPTTRTFYAMPASCLRVSSTPCPTRFPAYAYRLRVSVMRFPGVWCSLTGCLVLLLRPGRQDDPQDR
eukprot:1502354-Rhodomonas_salina.1